MADIVAWGVLHVATGYAAHRLGDDRLSSDGWGLRERRFENRGRWYRRRLRIHRWKDRVPATLLGAYGVLVNLPFIAIKRYNRFRIQALLARTPRRSTT